MYAIAAKLLLLFNRAQSLVTLDYNRSPRKLLSCLWQLTLRYGLQTNEGRI